MGAITTEKNPRGQRLAEWAEAHQGQEPGMEVTIKLPQICHGQLRADIGESQHTQAILLASLTDESK